MSRKGEPAPRGKRMSESELRRLWLDPAVRAADIAAIIGTTESAVYYRARARGLGPKARPRKVAWTPEMSAMWHAGVCARDMGRALGVAASTVSRNAAAAGMPPRCAGYRPAMTLAQWRECQLAARMASVAREETRLERARRGYATARAA